MARNTWSVYKKVGDVWTPDEEIYRPNEQFSLQKTSTQTKIQLADGSKSFVTAPALYVNSPLVFQWYYEDGTTKTKVTGYITNQTDLKLIDQNGVIYIGRFVSLNSNLMPGIEPDTYDLQATFERMPDISASSSSSSFSSLSSSSSTGV